VQLSKNCSGYQIIFWPVLAFAVRIETKYVPEGQHLLLHPDTIHCCNKTRRIIHVSHTFKVLCYL
jgi:hypothetical protein